MISSGIRPKLPKRTPLCTQGDLYIPTGRSAVVPVVYGRDDPNLVAWLRRGQNWLPALLLSDQGRPTGIRVVNISGQQV
jgi:hypothetical protein